MSPRGVLPQRSTPTTTTKTGRARRFPEVDSPWPWQYRLLASRDQAVSSYLYDSAVAELVANGCPVNLGSTLCNAPGVSKLVDSAVGGKNSAVCTKVCAPFIEIIIALPTKLSTVYVQCRKYNVRMN